MKSTAATAVLTTAAAPLPRALIVHRDSRTRSNYVQLLKTHAFLAESSADGRIALALAINWRPDVIVLEPRLDGIDGYQLCRLLRADPDTRESAILMVGAPGEPLGVIRGLDAGADAVLVTPSPVDFLVAEMRRALDRRQSTRRDWAAASRATPLVASASATKRSPIPTTDQRPMRPPALLCPECLSPLVYQRSHVGGVRNAGREQWDDFRCMRNCGMFQYRHRTRKLAKVPV